MCGRGYTVSKYKTAVTIRFGYLCMAPSVWRFNVIMKAYYLLNIMLRAMLLVIIVQYIQAHYWERTKHTAFRLLLVGQVILYNQGIWSQFHSA